jgi:acyl-coenzyme A thioesterase PaaI-like protein
MSESIFLIDGERPQGSHLPAEDGAPAMVVQPTEQARGPWDPRALHGGAPAALITVAFERMQPGAELRIARLGFEFLRPIPLAPLTLTTRIVRPGRRVQELAAELSTVDSGDGAGGELVCRAS